MVNKWLIATLILALGLCGFGETESLVSVAHIAYLDGQVTVTNRDGNQHRGVVNFPVMAGDLLRTDENSRGEIQLGNGTLLRLDLNSDLKVGTILAPLLSSAERKITTLEAKKGRFYVNSNTYNQELLQLVSEDVAVFFPRNANVEVVVEPETGTRVLSHWGRVNLLVKGRDGKEQAYELKGKQAAHIGKDLQLVYKPYAEEGAFMTWSRFVDNNFRLLHEGKSLVPDKIVRHAHLQRWAERWSSLFGEWVYDKMFGYVWKPNGFEMDPTRRPFYNGTVTIINGVQYVIPNEPWGWAPAHLGTWVFLKKWGWTWIPGQVSGEIFMPRATFFGDYICSTWGSYRLFGDYIQLGYDHWRKKFYVEHGYYPDEHQKESNDKVMRGIVRKLELAHPSRSLVFLKQMVPDDASKGFAVLKKGSKEKTDTFTSAMGGTGSRRVLPQSKDRVAASKILASGQALQLRHDWNPDRFWASENRVQLLYSAHSNSVIVPQMKLDSKTMTNRERSYISRTVNRDSHSSSGRSPESSQASSSSSSGNVSSGSSSKEIK
jgi:hypothetical protein